ncbi:MAG: protein-glutamate methylesterase/protein-glutamine glutaminase [Nitrososphaera sp.]|uniref:protein-glutamate methylesterase/protein-glutamine glutaminase n=1 Tax=Nitrososphaera sp. TaxID=1971748 RepID=UPI003D6E683B
MATALEGDKIQVMVVNDSAYMRAMFGDMIASSRQVRVCETATDGADALRKLSKSRPDVILLDLEMPNMDGLTFIENAMARSPVPIVVVSSYGHRGADVVFSALELGAVDFIPIPSDDPDKMQTLKETLISKIEVAAETNPAQLKARRAKRAESQPRERPHKAEEGKAIVVIGASTGGPGIVSEIMSRLPADLPAGVVIVQHMPEGFTKSFAERLNGVGKIPVREAREGDTVMAGAALLAPGDYHMMVRSSHRIELNKSPKRFGVRPAINMAMVSASEVYGSRTVGVLLTGMGHDGAFGMKMIKRRGGRTAGQDEASSVVFGMAKAAVEMDAVDRLLPADMIADEIVKMVGSLK